MPQRGKPTFSSSSDLYREVNMSSALTVGCFCSQCDDQIFRTLDAGTGDTTRRMLLLQAYRSAGYMLGQTRIDYETMLGTHRELGTPPSLAPTWRIKDRRIASNLKEEAAYSIHGVRYVLDALKAAIYGEANNVKVLYTSPQKIELEMLLSSACYINSGLFGMPLGMNWNNSGEGMPICFLSLLPLNGRHVLGIVYFDRHRQFVLAQVKRFLTLSDHEKGFHLFRLTSANNFGFAMSPRSYELVRTRFPDIVDNIAMDVRNMLANRLGQDWTNYHVPRTFPKLVL
ncbi:hypothetical protein SAMN04488032_1239 [Pacificibacter marinus]|uniref:Uncharacterized protein n=2 Tax=Pacificibacter marinus TaxID=658057 RepID=A0A1Y5TK38_9RHOB|nr:hypothetical protein SAMN04488032_1239 [Pacificibacter marinus]SLN65798.1 hypothetical protein PAM7971_03471 [Pacificibacter marinus]